MIFQQPVKHHNRGDRLYAARTEDCTNCPLKSRCTQAERRDVSRHAHEPAFERMQQRVKAYPEMMVRRRSIVENPFGSFKQWLFGNERFLLCQLDGSQGEMSLAVQAYNLKRAINMLGTR